VTLLAEVIQRMRATVGLPPTGWLSSPIDASQEIHALIDCIERLEKGATLRKEPTSSLMEEARRSWQQAGRRLDLITDRHIRALCGDPQISTDPQFVRFLSTHPKLTSNRQWIERLAESYLAEWRTMRQPDTLEALLQRAVATFRGRSERIDKYRPFGSSLFSPDAPAFLAKLIVDKRCRIVTMLEEWHVAPSGGLGEATANEALEQWIRTFEIEKRAGLSGSSAYERYRQLTTELLLSPMLETRRVGRAVSALILWDQADADEALHADLEEFILGDVRFGDPRLPANRTKWEVVDAAARQRAIAWLSKKDLLFFFNFVIDQDPHGRKEFWLNYVDQVEDSNVVLCAADERRLLAHTKAKERLRYSRITSGDEVSAFLMRFRGARGLIFIEFSESGNALYIHDADLFMKVATGIRIRGFPLGALKHHTRLHKVSHHLTTWRGKVRDILLKHGIRRA
jgi:hypothetical protein